jgi:peptide/nickel transport system permease protein
VTQSETPVGLQIETRLEDSRPVAAGGLAVPPSRSMRRFLRAAGKLARRNKIGAVGFVAMLLVVLIAAFSPVIQRYGENQTFQTMNPNFNPTASPIDIARNPDLSSPFVLNRWNPPGWQHWLGTDQYGRDIYARLIVGARLAVIIGVGASIIAVVSGTVTGLASGYFSGKVDLVLQRVIDAVYAFPGLVLLLLIVSLQDRPSLALTVGALGFLGWAQATRVVRSAVLSASASMYVEAARSYGASDLRVMVRHVLPNIMAAIIVIFSISIGLYILAEAFLSFLGLGPADQTTWGKMVNSGRNSLDLYPWESLFSGAAITLAVLAFNLAGDAIRDELDPRMRGRGGAP